MTYLQVYNLIKSALTGRTSGTKVEVENHEAAELAILDYVEQIKSQSSGMRQASGSSAANVNLVLTWNTAFDNTNYSYFLNGFDSRGNPAQIYYVSRTVSTITVKTLVSATIMAFASPNT